MTNITNSTQFHWIISDNPIEFKKSLNAQELQIIEAGGTIVNRHLSSNTNVMYRQPKIVGGRAEPIYVTYYSACVEYIEKETEFKIES